MLIATDTGYRLQEIDIGWQVMTADGKVLGVVEGVHPNHLIVIATELDYELFFIPTEAVTDAENDIVYLGVLLADTKSQGWELLPDLGEATATHRPRTRLTYPIQTERIGSLVVVIAALTMVVSLTVATPQFIVVSIALAIVGVIVQVRSEYRHT